MESRLEQLRQSQRKDFRFTLIGSTVGMAVAYLLLVTAKLTENIPDYYTWGHVVLSPPFAYGFLLVMCRFTPLARLSPHEEFPLSPGNEGMNQEEAISQDRRWIAAFVAELRRRGKTVPFKPVTLVNHLSDERLVADLASVGMWVGRRHRDPDRAGTIRRRITNSAASRICCLNRSFMFSSPGVPHQPKIVAEFC